MGVLEDYEDITSDWSPPLGRVKKVVEQVSTPHISENPQI